MSKARLEAFSDGVIAIIITIMVLELKVPHGEDLSVLQPLLPVFFSYILSFVYFGIYWNNHHHTRCWRRRSARTSRENYRPSPMPWRSRFATSSISGRPSDIHSRRAGVAGARQTYRKDAAAVALGSPVHRFMPRRRATDRGCG
jgi:hypothetical protein